MKKRFVLSLLLGTLLAGNAFAENEVQKCVETGMAALDPAVKQIEMWGKLDDKHKAKLWVEYYGMMLNNEAKYTQVRTSLESLCRHLYIVSADIGD